MRNWRDLRYLQAGGRRQRRAYAVLEELSIGTVLREFDPVLAGTVPLGIDTPTSDLDVICAVPLRARARFVHLLRTHYGAHPDFRLVAATVRGRECSIATFCGGEFGVEIFGQDQPTGQQHAVRHLLVEHAVLQAGGEKWRAAVQQLRRRGLKTEPAFAALLGLPGLDPYEELLELEGKTPAELAAWLAACPLAERLANAATSR